MDENNIIDLEDAKAGTVKISNDVVAVIAGIAASEIDGVMNISGGFVGGLAEIIGKKSATKGVKVETGEKEAAIDIYTTIKYGYKIPEVCAKVQQNVKLAVENMTGLSVVEVNVHVQGVHFEKDKSKDKEKEIVATKDSEENIEDNDELNEEE